MRERAGGPGGQEEISAQLQRDLRPTYQGAGVRLYTSQHVPGSAFAVLALFAASRDDDRC